MTIAGAQESQGLPVVLLVGDVAIGQKLLKALGVPSSTESKDTALGVIKNKYYSARVQYRLVATSAATAEELETAEALVLLWDRQKEQLKQLQALFPAETLDDGPDRVQICLAVDAGEGVEDAAREWCIDQGFEYLSCTLSGTDLEMLEQRCQQPAASRRTGLLDEDSENSVLRLMEALECHSSWPGMQPIASTAEKPPAESQQPMAEEDAKRNGYTALADATEAPKGKPADSKEPVQIEKVHDRIQDDDFAEADEFEKFAREMKEIREMRDHQSRKDRACDLALRLAASLGVDSDSD